MVQAPTPRRPQGCPWVLLPATVLVLALIASLPSPGLAQQPGPPAAGGEPPKAAADPAAPAAGAPAPEGKVAEEAVADPTKAVKAAPVEVYRDPRAEQFLDYEQFPELPMPRSMLNAGDREDRAIQAMANGGRVDGRFIHAYVEAMGAELSSHRNLKALVDPNPDRSVTSTVFEAIGRASDRLVTPLTLPQGRAEAGDTEFRREYVRALKDVLPKLLGGHLVSRTEAMIALGTAGHPDLITIYLEQLKDRNQVTMVKLWACRGLSRVALEGKRDVDQQRAIEIGRTLIDYLQNEADAPWFAKVRAFEALGAMRQASSDPLRGKTEMADRALTTLADPEANPSVRAWAGWSLGMMLVPKQIARYNFPLVAYHLGRAAADLGERAVELHTANPEQALMLTSLLGYQILPALKGEAGVRNSGLLNLDHPNIGPSKKVLTDITERVDAVVVAALRLHRSPPGQYDQYRKDLSKRVSDLRAYLLKNPPADRHLVPGGQEFPGGAAQVAEKNAK